MAAPLSENFPENFSPKTPAMRRKRVHADDECYVHEISSPIHDLLSENLLHTHLDSTDDVGPDDLIKLNPVTIQNVLTCLERRYRRDDLYTRAGSTLVAVNPFKPVPMLYSDTTIRSYQQNAKGCPPHVYSVGDEARRLAEQEFSMDRQTVIVSGESGAGKTETAKHLLNYLSSVCAGENCGQVEQRILDANPILESFGNATTCRNDNSSRFGKYIQVCLNLDTQITGAQIHTYLLEKTRVTQHAASEGNFHIFYELLAGLSPEDRRHLHLTSLTSEDFLITRGSERSTEGDKEKFWRVREAMEDIGLGRERQMKIFEILSAVLHLCNVQFNADEDGEFVTVNEDDSEESGSLSLSCRLLGVTSSRLEKLLTSREITASHSRRQSVFYRACSGEEAAVRRQTLAKMIYASLFEWLVNYINSAIKPTTSKKSVGILDIYGFECFIENSLEQLCINYANEKLQQHFVSSFLKELQDEYESEAVFWQRIDFTDNNKCLKLLEANPSVFSLLNEECHLNRPTNDEAVYTRLNDALKTHSDWSRPTRVKGAHWFAVKHYAGNVTYSVRGLVEKNKDNVPPELVNLLRLSENEFVRELFPVVDEKNVFSTPTKKQKTVLSKFKASLDSLMTTLRSSRCHYIRCVKPNSDSVPERFHAPYVRAQLAACGVAESVEICRNGFPSRLTYTEFLRRYGILLRNQQTPIPSITPRIELFPEYLSENKENRPVAKANAVAMDAVTMDMDESLDLLYERQLTLEKTPITPRHKRRRRTCVSGDDHSRKCCAAVLRLVFGETYTCQGDWTRQFGRTKIFLRDGELESLESAKRVALSNYAVRLQVAWRSRQVRKHYLQKRLSAIKIQAAVRGWLARRHVELLRQDLQTLSEAHSLIHELETSMCSMNSLNSYTDSRRTSSHQNFQMASRNDDLKHDHDINWRSFEPVLKNRESLDSGHESNSSLTKDHVIETQYSDENKDSDTEIRKSDSEIGKSDTEIGKLDIVTPGLPVVMEELRRGEKVMVRQLDATRGIVSIRRLPRVSIKFHVRANPVLKYGHYMSRRELQCSLTDCLAQYDQGGPVD